MLFWFSKVEMEFLACLVFYFFFLFCEMIIQTLLKYFNVITLKASHSMFHHPSLLKDPRHINLNTASLKISQDWVKKHNR